MANLSALQKRGITQGLSIIDEAASELNQMHYQVDGLGRMIQKLRCLDISMCPEPLNSTLKTSLLEIHQASGEIKKYSLFKQIQSGIDWVKDATEDDK